MNLTTISWLVQEWNLYILLAMLPLSKATVEVTSTLMIIAWLVDRARPATRRQTIWFDRSARPLAIGLIAYTAVCALSITVSRNPMSSVDALVGKWMQYLMMMVVTADILQRPRVIKRSLIALAISAVLVLIEAFTQEHNITGGIFLHHRLDYFWRMTGPYENPIDLATYLMVVIPIFLAWARSQGRTARIALGVLIAALLACLGRTRAFGPWLGLCLALGVLVLADRWLRRAALVTLLAGVVAWLAFAFVKGTPDFHHIFSTPEIGKADRLAMWQAALGMIHDRPLLGHGLNTFMANYLDYWVGGERQPRYAHNCYLQVAAETGLIGLTAFLFLLWETARWIVTGWRRMASTRPIGAVAGRVALLAALSGSLLAFAAQSAIDTNFYSLRQAALFWTLAGVALGVARLGSADADG